MAGFYRNYAVEEEMDMLKYVEDKKVHHCLRGDKMYMDMALELQNGRTWQSLKNHKTKYLVQKLEMPCYQLTQEQIQTFKVKFQESARPRTASHLYRIYQTFHRGSNISDSDEDEEEEQHNKSFNLANTHMSSSDEEEEPDKTPLPNERPSYAIEPDSDTVFEIPSDTSGSTTDCEGQRPNSN